MEQAGVYIGMVVTFGLFFVILKEITSIIVKLGELAEKIASLVSITHEATHNPEVKSEIVNPDEKRDG